MDLVSVAKQQQGWAFSTPRELCDMHNDTRSIKNDVQHYYICQNGHLTQLIKQMRETAVKK